MTALANVALTNTFFEQMVRINQIVVKTNDMELSSANSFVRANLASVTANAAFDRANLVSTNTAAAFTFANAVNSLANSANITAIVAGAIANASIITANAAFDKANAANVLAYDTGVGANSFLLVVISGANTAVGTGANAYSATVGSSSNTYLLATLSGANTIASSAYDKANSANIIAVAAFAAANASNGTSAKLTIGTIELGHASDTTLSRSAAGELAVEGTIVKKVGKETIWAPASAMTVRTTNGAAVGTVETTTNKIMLSTLDFDTTTQEFAQLHVRMPKSWDEGTVTATFTWSHASTSTNFGVVWALEAVALSDGDAGDAAVGTAQQVADTGGTTNMVYITSETSAITIAGSPAAEDWVAFQIKRVPSDASDTMSIDARLHGVTIYFTTNASTDA